MSEPKEFWIAPKLYSPIDPVEAEYYVAYDQKDDPKRLEIHVIEYSAYEKLQADLKAQSETLVSVQAALDVAMHALKHPWLLEELSCECGYYGDDNEEQGMSICQKCTIESALSKIEELLSSDKLPNSAPTKEGT